MKVQVSLDDDLLKRIDKYAEDNYMSRSGLVSFATNQYLCQAEVVGLVKEMTLAMRKIADTGSVDKNTMQQLEDLERVCKLLTSTK